MTADERAPVDTAALREALDAATPGPWHPATTGVEGGDHWSVIDYPTMDVICHIRSDDGDNEDVREPNARLIAQAVNALPTLLDELDAARVELLEQDRDFEQMRTFRDTMADERDEACIQLDAAQADNEDRDYDEGRL